MLLYQIKWLVDFVVIFLIVEDEFMFVIYLDLERERVLKTDKTD